MTTNDTSRTLQNRLVARLAEWMKLPLDAAERTFNDTTTAKSLADESCNLRYQTEEYVFSCLKDELLADDLPDDDFERPEEAPEGCFVRSH